jgi:cytoskeletal protein CcmA (bactofilin family)
MAKIKESMAMSANAHNILAAGTHIKGEINAEEDFRIDGSIDGNIHCKGKIIVGTSSTITGEIKCMNIEVLGKVDGNIFCTENVFLRATSTVTGNVKTGTIEIEIGAAVKGDINSHYKQDINTTTII